MARLKSLPEFEIIKGFRGVLDFALWKGLPYARKWPRSSKASQTPATQAAAVIFGQVIRLYALLCAAVLAFYVEDAKTQTRTARDIMVSGVYGHLHEATMSDFLTLLQESRDFLSQLTALLNALDSVGTDEIDVNVEDSVLPTGASTSANQTTALTSLQLIDDLADALESVDTDALQVRGRDQLWSYKGQLQFRLASEPGAPANVTLDTSAVPAGEVWIVTTCLAWNDATANTSTWFAKRDPPSDYEFGGAIPTVVGQLVQWSGHFVAIQSDVIRCVFNGCQGGDVVRFRVLGHIMTLET